MKWVLVIAGLLLALVIVAFIVGSFQPKTHVASVTFRVAKPDSVVWAEVANIEKSPEWVPDVRSVTRLPDNAGRPSYRENFGGFEATTVIAVSETSRKLVKEILPSGPFYGSWTWELSAEGDATRLTITEQGTIENPLFRALMIFNDNQKTMRQYGAALGRRLGVEVVEIP